MHEEADHIDEALNILLLGETGVGKSTWINATANYLTFENLEEAAESETVCLIPTRFAIADEDRKQHVVEFGEFTNESSNVGESATQTALAHVFNTPQGKIRIIDTPGIGDTKGPDQDKKNLENVLRYIAQLKKLHGICILIKPNESRLTPAFRYRINELLTHLSRSASRNIVFCFTNARGTFFEPGDTLCILEKFLEDLKNENGVDIQANDDTMFCLDNEAFRFLIAAKQGIKFPEKHLKVYRESWKESQSATRRLFNQVLRFIPHQLQDTVSINNARRLILTLAKPLADIMNNIQLNRDLLKAKQEELTRHKGTREDLLNKVKIVHLGIEVKSLKHPRTVCTSPNHVDTVKITDSPAMQTIYKTHCHARCYLTNVVKETVPEPALQRCAAMSGWLFINCTHCGCKWSQHMHIYFEQKQVSKEVDDPPVREAIENNEQQEAIIRQALLSITRIESQLTKEHATILSSGAKFATFLREYAIKTYNDALEDYLNYAIKEEERLIAAGKTNDFKLRTYKENIEIYREEKKTIDEALKKGSNVVITADEVMNLISELEGLAMNGKSFQELLKASVIGEKQNFSYTEKHFDPAKVRNSEWKMLDFVSGVLN